MKALLSHPLTPIILNSFILINWVFLSILSHVQGVPNYIYHAIAFVYVLILGLHVFSFMLKKDNDTREKVSAPTDTPKNV